MKKILLVEDDPIIARSLTIALRPESIEITHASTIAEGREMLDARVFDLLLLDINLPDGSGIDFCKEIKESRPHFPIIILTAKTDEESAVSALKFGAEDYVRKPFGNKELVLRINKHVVEREEIVLMNGQFVVDYGARKVSYCGNEIALSNKEFEIISIFVKRPGQVFSREDLLEKLQTGSDVSDRTIDAHISNLRTKLKKLGPDTPKVKSVYGIGYRLVV